MFDIAVFDLARAATFCGFRLAEDMGFALGAAELWCRPAGPACEICSPPRM
ncbi:hypothetical protein [Rhizobium sp. CC-YZS058]|uniref:hypothetical protein n=1 Tax=Rhizobium sp. CC-YZS058 TaxID=3042153 RepID=UPI002B051AB3|nr:hypothetical protein [Rhizobium sp. CC-YZS058]MEA3536208.1 hypothetical protein [Rhizobium sp. CC-YZS058]